MKKSFTERLEAHPELKRHIEQKLDVVENIEGKADKANDAEIQVVDNMRKFGAAALQEWAMQREKATSANRTAEHPTTIKQGKKSPLGNNSWTKRNRSPTIFA